MTTAQRKKIDSLVAKLRAAEEIKAKDREAAETYDRFTADAMELAARTASRAVEKKRTPKSKALWAKSSKSAGVATTTSTAATSACTAAGLNMTETMALLFPEQ